MTDASLAYALSIRRQAERAAQIGTTVTVTLNPPSALYLAALIERGCQRSEYVRTVEAEAERLRDRAENMVIAAEEVVAAADAERAGAADVSAAADQALAAARVAGNVVLEKGRRARRLWWGGLVFWVAGLLVMAGVLK